ncbi:MAG TPA: TonB-dependent receptor [Prolixibacteraceae bacterium]|nr:TonB-dependent receptor [Prolixibacteraceae bacterium]
MKKKQHFPDHQRLGIKKLLLVMKLTTIFVFFSVMAMAVNTFSQETRFDLNVKNASLIQVFDEIERVSNYGFLFKTDQLDLSKEYTLDIKNSNIEKILKEVLNQDEYSYRMIDRNIVITRIDSNTNQDNTKVTGKVTDSSGNPLPGVSVVLKGTTNGTITDTNGNYSISNIPLNATLQFSFVGMKMQQVSVGNKTILNVTLEDETIGIEEVVAIGYGTQKKSDVTGSMIRVSEEELNSRPVANAIEAMQGKAAGVDITSNERPGEIGKIFIRGLRSLTASNSPLYVLDGIPIMSSSGIETMNPADIESIDILKDASATAIYGSRGANGVVLVTTKKGKAGKLSFNYSGSMTIENIQDRTEMMGASEYLTWRRWGYYYLDPAKYPRGDQPTQENDYKIFLGANDQSAWNNIMKGWDGGTWDGSKVQTTDWAAIVTQTGVSSQHNISASGGTEKMKAYVSFGYLDTKGTMKGQSYTRYTTKVSVDVNPIKWFEMGASINSTYSIQQYGQSHISGQSTPGSIYAAANSVLPYAVPYDANGNRITYPGGDDGMKTIVDEWNYSINERKMFRAMGSLYAQLNILPGLKYRANFGPDFRFFKNGTYTDAMSVDRLGSPNIASLRNQNDFSWTLDNLLYFDKKIDKHTFGATLLQTTSAWNTNFSTMSAQGIPLVSQKWNALNKNNIASLDNWDSGLTDRQLMSYMGRFNYSFADKYLLTVSGRWDGASQLAAGHKWAFFPSAALAWRIDQENWIKNIDWINQLKARLGVGTTGNSAIQPYQTKGGVVSLFYPFGSSVVPGYVPSESLIKDGNLAMANQNLGWEKTTQYNLGFDFSLLRGRVSGVLDLYTSQTKNLLMQMNIPSLTGYTTTFSNVGETKNNGIDITINTVNVKTKDFTWETSLNAAWQENKIVSLSNGKSDDISNLWFIGQPIGVIYSYASAGLWHEEDAAEMAKFNANGHKFQIGGSRPVDQNGDHKISPNDDRVIIGNTIPRWTVGLTNSFTYKNFDFSCFLYGRLGYTFNTGGEWQGGRGTQRSISYYNENNKNAEYQKPIYNVGVGDPYYNIMGYRSGSFIKIRDINLGYTFPVLIAKKLGLETLKIYVQAKNPGILYSKVDWLDMDLSISGNGTNNDPTISTSAANRGFIFGVNVGF